MFPKYLLCFTLIAFTSTGAIPRRLNPQCRSNACDDRPQCPRTSCRCLFPSRMDCAVYYQCINGKPFQYRCSPGLLFNNETLTCDYSYNVKCDMSTTRSPVSTGADNITSIGYVTTTEIPDESTTVDVTEKGVNKQTVTNKVTESKTSPVSSKTFQTDATHKESSSSSEETDAPTMSETTPESSTVEITQKQTSHSVTVYTEKESTTFETTLGISTSPAASESTTELTEDTTSNKITSETARELTSTQTTVDLQTSTSQSIITNGESTIAELTEVPRTIVFATTTVKTNDRSTAFISTTLLDLITTTQSPSTKIDKIVTNSTFDTTKNDIITSTESPTSEFLCPSRFALFADPKSCKRFYHCSQWKPYHKWCPSDLHFNPKLRVCDWPYRAGCDTILPPSVPDNTPTPKDQNDGNVTCDCDMCELPVLSECTAYILCINKVGDKIYCSPGLYFNRMTGTCDLPENVECLEDNYDCSESSGRYLLEGSCSYFVECRNGEKSIKTCPEGLQFNQSSEMCSWLGSCAGLPDKLPTSKTTADLAICNGCTYCFKPIMSDCTRYVRCSQGVASEERCPSGLFFNSDTEMCDHSYNVQCPDPEPNPECPERFGYFPYPGECGKYLQCINGSASVKTCPGVLHFDPVKKHCDYPWAAGCNDSNSRPTPEPSQGIAECDCDCCLKPVGTDCRNFTICINRVSFTGSCSSGLLFNPHTENCDFAENVDCAVPPEIPAYNCPEYQGLFPHPEDCRKFIHCAHGFPYIKDCPANLHFNPKLNVCDWPYSAGCQADPTNDPTIEDGDDHNLPCDICDSCFIPDESDCASYMYCQNGTGHRLRCTGNLLFNPDSETCDLASNVKCPNQPTSNCPKPDGLFAAKDCSQFIHCSHGIAYLKDCPDGLHFNTQILVCDWPENVKCGEVPIEPTLPPTDDDDDNDASNRSCNCDCCFLPDDKDCSKYILCLDGLMHFGQCSRGLLFNPSIQNCDLAERVTCGGISSLCLEPNGLFQNKEQCSSYIKCLDGNVNVEYCPNGMHFSAYQRQCLDPCKAQCDPTYNCEPSSSTTPQIPSSTLSPFCPEMDGLFPNTEDCSSFYQCSNGRPFLVQCPSGLHFDKKYEICDYPCNAKCNASIDCDSPSTAPSTTPHILSSTLSPFCPEMDGLFPNTEDCSSLYLCSSGRASLLECSPGLHFDAKHKVCDYPCNAKCNTSIDCESSYSTPSTMSPTPSSTTLSPFCPEKDGLFPNRDNCSSFYQCSAGKAYLVQCPPGLHFDEKHKVCDYPCNAKCNTSIDCASSSSTSTTTATTSTSTSTPSSFCPERNGLFPNEDNCASFYQCSEGKAHLVECPSGLHFSDEHKVCEYPCNAKCDSTLDCSPVTLKPTSSGGSANCPLPNGLYPVDGDCTAFYLCSNSKDYLIPCPPGLHFSVKLETCEKPCIAECNASLSCFTTMEPTSSTPHPLSPECKEPDGLFENPDDCGSFYQCSGGRSNLIRCPNGLHFSLDDSACEKPCVAGCDLNIECPREIPETKDNCTCNGCYFPDPTDCSAFYYCDDGQLSKSYCPFGTLFSETSSICEDENTVDCENNGDPGMCPEPYGFFPYQGDCKKFIHCDSSIAHIKECQGDLEYDPQHRVCTNPKGYCGEIDSDPNCPEPTGMFPDSKNCSLFYHCEHGVAYPKRCSPPLMFNPEKRVCDWPNNVDCGKENVSSTSPAPTPKPTPTTPATNNITISSSLSTIASTPSTSECHEVPGVICPCACRVPTYDECSSYFQCQEDGTACKKFCPEGLYFNKREMVCDLPENVECRDFFFSSIRRAKQFSHRFTP